LLSGESSSLSVHGVYCGVSRRLNDLSIEPGEDQCLSKGEGELDSESRFALTFFESYGYTERDFGDAEGLAKARNISVEGVAKAGILRSLAGKSWLLKRENLDGDWDPALDARLCVWEATQHLIKRLESGGEGAAGDLLKQLKKISGHGDLTSNCRALAYRLYSHCDKTKQAEEARAYNGLVIAWPELEKLAAASASPVQPSLL
jgi:putative DNA methylase